MLEKIRHISKTLWFRIFLFILAACFGFLWSVGEMFFRSHHSVNIIAKIGHKELTTHDFLRRVKQGWTHFKHKINDKIDTAEALKTGLMNELSRRAVQQFIEQSLIELEANRLKIIASDQLVQKFIQSQPQFMEKGRYSQRLLRQVLFQTQLSEKEFIEQVRNDIKAKLLLTPLMMNISLPQHFSAPIYAWSMEERKLEVLSLKGIVDLTLPTPKASDLEAFFNDHSYLSPEKRTIEILVVDSKIVREEPEPEELSASYQTYKNAGGRETFQEVRAQLIREFKRSYGADQILDMAGKIQDQLSENTSLEVLGHTHQLNTFTYHQVKRQDDNVFPADWSSKTKQSLLEKAFSMQTHSMPTQITTPEGEVVFMRIVDVTSPTPLPFHDVKTQVHLDWIKAQETQLLQVKRDELLKKTTQDPKFFNTLTKKTHSETYWTKRDGLKQKDQKVTYTPTPAFLQRAFSAHKGEIFSASLNDEEVIVRVQDIEKPIPHLESHNFQSMKERLTQQYTEDFLMLYIRTLHKRYQVNVDYKLLERTQKEISTEAF